MSTSCLFNVQNHSLNHISIPPSDFGSLIFDFFSVTFDLLLQQVLKHLQSSQKRLGSELWRFSYFTLLYECKRFLHLEAIALQSHYQITSLKTHWCCLLPSCCRKRGVKSCQHTPLHIPIRQIYWNTLVSHWENHVWDCQCHQKHLAIFTLFKWNEWTHFTFIWKKDRRAGCWDEQWMNMSGLVKTTIVDLPENSMCVKISSHYSGHIKGMVPHFGK